MKDTLLKYVRFKVVPSDTKKGKSVSMNTNLYGTVLNVHDAKCLVLADAFYLRQCLKSLILIHFLPIQWIQMSFSI